MSVSDVIEDNSRPTPPTGTAQAEARRSTEPGGEASEPTGAPNRTTPAPADQASAPAKKRRLPLRQLILLALLAGGVIGGGFYGYDWWTNGRFLIGTDDAYIEGDITIISPKVSGYVEKVNVIANQTVKAGDPLITIDGTDYRIAADEAKAKIATQELTIDRIGKQIEAGRASLAQARAEEQALAATAANAKSALERTRALEEKGTVSDAALDSAQAAYDKAHASLAGADAAIKAASANIAVLQAQQQEAKGSLTSLHLAAEKADRDFSQTVLRAPYDGVVGNIAAHKGDLVSAGQRLAAVVPMNALYVNANYKETQLSGIVAGETAEIRVDAYDTHPIMGKVVSISPASGAVFSLLPANNATGNFTKVVQRVPVRIALPADALASGRLRAGLSVVVDIDRRTAPASPSDKAKSQAELTPGQ